MSQHDLNIADQTYPAFRVDLNNALVALGSLSAGSSAPGSPTTKQLWLDDSATPWVLKIYDGTDWIRVIEVNSTTNRAAADSLITPLGFLSGLTLSNNGSDANNDIDIAVGAAVDSAGAKLMALLTGMTKRLDASWAAGTNMGGLFSGAKANSTWYHVHLIHKTADGTIDAGFDTSITAANIPAGYAAYRRLGSVRTDGSGNILAFLQKDDHFVWAVPSLEIAGAATTGAWTNLTLRVPPGIATLAYGAAQIGDGGSGGASELAVRNPAGSDPNPVDGNGIGIVRIGSATTEIKYTPWGPVLTDTSSRVAYYVAGNRLYLTTKGWIDARGRG